jgi:membrane-associated phospholipid phosphatase
MRSALGGFGLSLLAWMWPATAAAQRDLDVRQSDAWYGVQAGLFGLGVVGTLSAQLQGDPLVARFHETFWFEGGTSRNFSLVSSRISDVSLGAAFVAPVVVLAAAEPAQRFENSLLIYGETLSLSLWVGTAVKQLVARGRPYSAGTSEGALAFTKSHEHEQLLSFYSGHSAIGFTSATAGGFLFADGHADPAAKAAFWAAELALAGFTAHARVRAGMHYPSDVIFGSLVGTAFGLGVPLLQDVRPDITSEQWLAIGGGVVAGAAAAFLLPTGAAARVAEYQPHVTPVTGGAIFGLGSSW